MKIEPNNIYLGDCYELIKEIPDKSIDLIITDPPYEIIGGGSGGCFGTGKRDYHSEYKKLSREEHKREGLRIRANFNKLENNLNCICAGFDYSLLDQLDRVMKHIYILQQKSNIFSYETLRR